MFIFRSVLNPREVQLKVTADLIEGNVAEFRAALYAELDQPGIRVLLDLDQVRSINSAALGAMLLVQKKALESGKVIAISKCGDELRKTLLAIRIDRIIEIVGEAPPTITA